MLWIIQRDANKFLQTQYSHLYGTAWKKRKYKMKNEFFFQIIVIYILIC